VVTDHKPSRAVLWCNRHGVKGPSNHMGSKVISSKFKEAFVNVFVTNQQWSLITFDPLKGQRQPTWVKRSFRSSGVTGHIFKLQRDMFCYTYKQYPINDIWPLCKVKGHPKVNIFSVMSPRYVIWGRTCILKVFGLILKMTPEWPLTPFLCTPYRHWL
jgi:hypothetical protein